MASGSDTRPTIENQLTDHSEKLALVALAGVGVWDMDIPSQMVRGTDQFFKLIGLPPTDRPVPIETIRAARVAEDQQRVVRGYIEAIEAGQDSYESEYRVQLPDGEIRWIYGRGRVLRDAAGKPVRYTGVDIDITERKHAEAVQRDNQLRLKLALDAANLTIWEVDAGGAMKSSPGLGRVLGFEPGSDAAAEIRARALPGELDRVRETARTALAAGRRDFQAEFSLRADNNQVRWFLIRAEIQLGAEGEPNGAIGVMMDISDRIAAEEHQRLLTLELDHRIKNTLATVQGISRQTFRGAQNTEEATKAFDARLAALAGAHTVVTSASWRSADVVDIVGTALEPFRDPNSDRFVVSGPSIPVTPQVALALAMTLHELCTNAVKYGALAWPAGQVDFSWKLSGEPARLVMRWAEVGGPPVAPPTVRGFGTRLITESLANVGTVRMEYPAAGLVCTIDIAFDATATDPV